MITSAPKNIHAAFNPIIFKCEKGTSTSETASITLVDVNMKSHTIMREYTNGIAFINISSIIRGLFNEKLAEMTSKIVADKKLYTTYTVYLDSGSFTKRYCALNSSLQVKEKLKSHGDILSYLKNFYKYENYPFDISILTETGFASNKGMFNSLSVNRFRVDDNESPLIFDELLATSQGYTFQTSKYNFIGFDKKTEINFVQRCTPANPFYVRWINTLGGVDYWMFSVSQKSKITLKNTDTYEPYIITDENYSEKPFSKEGNIIITAGAENLTKDEYKALSLLPMSNYIEWYNEELNEWILLNVSKADNESITGESKQSVEIDFELPKLNLQY